MELAREYQEALAGFILWKKYLKFIVTPLPIGINRKPCLQSNGDPNLIIISVYLHCKSSIKTYVKKV